MRNVHLPLAMQCLWVVTIGFAIIVAGIYRARGSANQPRDRQYESILTSVMAARPSAVDVSPNGRYIVTKEKVENGFRLAVLDQASKHFMYTRVANTQYGLAWRPDSRAFAYQEESGPDRPLCLFDLASGKTRCPNIPVSQSAELPARWSPNGKYLAYFDGDWRGGRLLFFAPETGDSPHVIEDSVVPDNADFAWSPTSTAIAVVAKLNSGITIKDLVGRTRNQINIAEEVKTIAWSSDGNFILAMVRGPTDEYFKLIEVRAETGHIFRETDDAGDISNPFWLQDDRSFIYEITSNQTTRIVLRGPSGGKRIIGPANGKLRLTHLSSDGKYAYARYAGCTRPPSLVQISLNDGSYCQIYAPPLSSEVLCPQPEMINLKSKDGTMIPAYYWHISGKSIPPRAALIVVHGGPHDQADETWDSLQYVMLKRGCDVIAVNYRGSSGFGQSFRIMGNDSERVWDVLAARDYAVNSLKVRPSKVFLLGSSYGASLAACAAAQGGEIGGLILVSWPRAIQSADIPLHLERSVQAIEFHGADDTMLSPTEARVSMEQFFESAGNLAGEPHQIVFKNEGHFFYQDSSIAREYWLAVKMMGLD